MNCPINDEQLEGLKVFIALCKNQPQILHHPKLSFFKEYLTSLGVNIPTVLFGGKTFTASGDTTANNAEEVGMSSGDDSEPESDVELDMEGVIEPDVIDDNQAMGNDIKEPTEEERDQSDEKRSEAMKAFSQQNSDEAIKLYSEAIELNPTSALLFAKRGQVYLKLNKPNACIKDCTRALELNCDSAAAYKFRGRAYRLLGKFEESSHDLCESLKIDYDDQANEWLNEVKANAEKLRAHKLCMQRKKEDKTHREKVRRARKAQEARVEAARAQAEATANAMPPGGMGFAGMGAGGMDGLGNMSPDDLRSLLLDPELTSAFQDPEVANAFIDVSKNPANFIKYQGNPKISSIIEKLQGKLGKTQGHPGSGPKPDDDVGLD